MCTLAGMSVLIMGLILNLGQAAKKEVNELISKDFIILDQFKLVFNFRL
jgi:hypothetical protein